MGVILLPTLGGMTLSWMREDTREAGVRSKPLLILGGFFGSVLIVTLGLALLSSIALIQLGSLTGTLLSFILILFIAHRRLGLGCSGIHS
jgi:hypothetical protein